MLKRALDIPTAEVFEPLLGPARYKGAFGSRGSGKSQFFADETIDAAVRWPGDAGEGLRHLCIREIQKSLKQSAKRLIEKKLVEHRLGERDGFRVYESVIKTPGDGVIDFTGMQDHTADSIKSYEGFHSGWIEEGQTLSATSLALLRPTIRWEDKTRSMESEIWASWNPRKKTDPVDVMFRGGNPPTGAICVTANWRDNPWFPQVLEQERLDCLNAAPEQYDHIWEGGYVTVLEGAYYAKHIQEARQEGRIGVVGKDPLMAVRAFADLGGTGNKSDAFALWIAQFVGKQIRVLDYYEALQQDLATHLAWMRSKKYLPGEVSVWLPHDGKTNDRVYDVSFESAFKQAGYDVEVITNQGKGAAASRIESVRRTFPNAWFNEVTTEPGLDALGWYHEKKDETRNVGLGPEHDWASHGADAYGLLSIVYEEFSSRSTPTLDINQAFRRHG